MSDEVKRYSMKVSYSTGFLPWVESKYDTNGAWVMHSDILSLARRAVEAEKKVARWEACNAKEIEAINQAKNLMAGAQRCLEASQSRVRELEQQYQEAYMVSVAAKNDAEALRERVRELEESLRKIAFYCHLDDTRGCARAALAPK